MDLSDDDHTRLKQIQKVIRDEISQLSHIGSPLPDTWLQVRENLEQHPANTINQQQYLDLCAACGINNNTDALMLSQYLHDIGVFLHFQDDAILKNTLFLKPNWATNAIYQVLDDNSVHKSQGILSKSQAQTIWQDEQFSQLCDEFLQLMKKFHLAFQLKNSEKYIVPAKLPTAEINYQQYFEQSTSGNLQLRYQYQDFMPKGLLFHLMAEAYHLIDSQDNVWRRGVILNNNQAIAVVREHYIQKAINIRLTGHNQRDLLAIVMDKLDEINSHYDKLKVEKYIPCHCAHCHNNDNPHFYKFSDLERRKQHNITQTQCEISYEMVNVQSLLDVVVKQPKQQQKQQTPQQKATIRDQIFISYSHQDRAIFNQIQTKFKAANNLGLELQKWDDTQIQPGQDWFEQIKQNLARTKVAVLLISDNFLASDFIKNEELPEFIDAMKQQGLTILSLILEPCLFTDQTSHYQL